MTTDLVEALSNLKEKEALDITAARLQSDERPLNILNDARRAMEIVGERFAQAVYFLPDLVYAGEILRQISEMAKPKLTETVQEDRLGKCVIGTVAGDTVIEGAECVATTYPQFWNGIKSLGVRVTTDGE